MGIRLSDFKYTRTCTYHAQTVDMTHTGQKWLVGSQPRSIDRFLPHDRQTGSYERGVARLALLNYSASKAGRAKSGLSHLIRLQSRNLPGCCLGG